MVYVIFVYFELSFVNTRKIEGVFWKTWAFSGFQNLCHNISWGLGIFLKFSGYFGSILEIFITFLHGDFERDFSGFGRDLHGDFQKFYDNFKGFIGITEKFWQDIRIFLWIFYFWRIVRGFFESFSKKLFTFGLEILSEVRKYRKHLETCMCFSIKVYTNIQSCKIFTMNCVMGAWERHWLHSWSLDILVQTRQT